MLYMAIRCIGGALSFGASVAGGIGYRLLACCLHADTPVADNAVMPAPSKGPAAAGSVLEP